MKKLLNATISEELIEQLKNNSTRGKFSEYTEEVIRVGLKAINEQPSTVDECIEKLIRAYKKEKQNKAPIIEQKEEQIQEPIQEEPIIEQDEYKPIKDFLYKRYIELRDEFDKLDSQIRRLAQSLYERKLLCHFPNHLANLPQALQSYKSSIELSRQTSGK